MPARSSISYTHSMMSREPAAIVASREPGSTVLSSDIVRSSPITSSREGNTDLRSRTPRAAQRWARTLAVGPLTPRRADAVRTGTSPVRGASNDRPRRADSRRPTADASSGSRPRHRGLRGSHPPPVVAPLRLLRVDLACRADGGGDRGHDPVRRDAEVLPRPHRERRPGDDAHGDTGAQSTLPSLRVEALGAPDADR